MAVLLQQGGEVTITEQDLFNVDSRATIETTYYPDRREYRITLKNPALAGEVVPEEPRQIEAPPPASYDDYECCASGSCEVCRR